MNLVGFEKLGWRTNTGTECDVAVHVSAQGKAASVAHAIWGKSGRAS
ncbi:hypothetical protein M3J09_012179 [Ascochyta lentis]